MAPKTVTALCSGARPRSVCSGAHGESSSFSAMQHEYLAGVPWVAWSSTCGRRPNALIEPSLMARPIVAYFFWRVFGIGHDHAWISIGAPIVIAVTLSLVLMVFPLLIAERRLARRN